MNDDSSIKILSFTDLKKGWLDGTESDPISRETADLALAVMTSLENDPSMPDFRAYPTPDGEVQFEWREDSLEKEIRVFAYDLENND